MATKTKNARLELKASDIPRYIPGTKLAEDVVKELAAKSKALLEYDLLADRTEADIEPLAEILARLGIEVLDREAVEQYKLRKSRPDVDEALVEDEEDTDDESRDNRQYEWANTSISSFRRPIPERVLAKCVQIKEASPSAEFRVHYLKRDLDPFMEVRKGDEHFYIEVWDEPNFTNKVTEEDAKRANLKSKPNA